MRKAYIVGRLQAVRENGNRRLELQDIQITSEPAASLTCMDGTYWCDFGEPVTAETFGEAAELAEPIADGKRQWLGLPPYERK